MYQTYARGETTNQRWEASRWRAERSSFSLKVGPPQNSLGELGFHYPPFLCDEEKKDGRERTKEKEQNRGGKDEKKEAFDRAVWRPCVNEPVKGSYCLAATSIWYCTFLFLPHCLLSQCLLSPPLSSLSLSPSLKEIGGLRPTKQGLRVQIVNDRDSLLCGQGRHVWERPSTSPQFKSNCNCAWSFFFCCSFFQARLRREGSEWVEAKKSQGQETCSCTSCLPRPCLRHRRRNRGCIHPLLTLPSSPALFSVNSSLSPFLCLFLATYKDKPNYAARGSPHWG